jgi:acetyl-CoA carboxylase carboxyl transferase subunit alpha
VVLMLQYAVYSVISPEGCASILWRDGKKAPEAAEAMKITADSLLSLGIIDEILPEPAGAAHSDPAAMVKTVKAAVLRRVKELNKIPLDELVSRHYQKLRLMGSASLK